MLQYRRHTSDYRLYIIIPIITLRSYFRCLIETLMYIARPTAQVYISKRYAFISASLSEPLQLVYG